MLTRKQILREEKSDVDAQKPNSLKRGGPLMRGNNGRYGTVMQKPPTKKLKIDKRFTSK